MSETQTIGPGGTVGILGGGQLGRMLAMAAARMGLRARIYCPEPSPPAGDVAAGCSIAPWDDRAALDAFADAVDVVTLEFENVPVETVEILARRVPVRPGARALAVAQDRLEEKRFLRGLGLETAPFAPVDDAAALGPAMAEIGAPSILKTRRLGYDGRGQAWIEGQNALGSVASLAENPAILEGAVPFVRELSVIAARGLDGSFRAYDPAENVHETGVLRRSAVPAAIDAATADRATEIARRILDGLDYVGVMGVELFHTEDGRLLVNEIAPRVHNTGHWTLEACAVDQFEQHLRVVCGWPLGDPLRHADAAMENLLGEEAADWAAYAAAPGVALHLYGKAEARPGRKMGHLTRLSPRSGG